MNVKLERKKSDVLVIGSGVAGLMAAYQIFLGGDKTVAILSTGYGASPHITGFDVPVAQGDSPECFLEDTVRSGWNQNDPELVEMFARESVEIVPFLEELDFPFDREENGELRKRHPIGASYPRVIGIGNHSGSVIIRLLKEKMQMSDKISFETAARALRLLVKDGAVYGAFAYDTEQERFCFYEAGTVILANGGFSRLFDFSTNTQDIGGDGIAMAYHAGAKLTDLEFVQFEPAVALHPEGIYGHGVITTLMYEGAVLVNAEGERFMLQYGPEAERVNKDILGNGIYREIQEGRGGEHGGVFFDATAVGKERLMDAYAYYYRTFLNAGLDMSCEKIEVAPAALTSLGGVAIDKTCRTNIDGLLACGEVSGNVHGANRIGGAAGIEALVFGRKAGMTVKAAPAACRDSISDEMLAELLADLIGDGEPLAPEAMTEMKHRLGKILSGAFNLRRNEQDMRAASEQILTYWQTCKDAAWPNDPREAYQRLRLMNDLTTAYLLALSAMDRTETLGCHVRSDAVCEVSERYHTVIQKNDSGPAISRTPV